MSQGLNIGCVAIVACCLLGEGAFVFGQQPALSDEGRAARALWEAAIKRITSNFYEPVDELVLTRATVELLIQAGPPDAINLMPTKTDYGTTPEAWRSAIQKFVSEYSARLVRTEPRLTPAQVVEHGLKLLCQKHLKHFARYVSSKETGELYELEHLPKAAGLDMRIECREDDGRFFCFPLENGLAWQCGIRPEDELVSLNGKAVEQMNRAELSAHLHGAKGSTVSVGVRQFSTGRVLRAKLTRSATDWTRIRVTQEVTGPVIYIPTFGEKTTDVAANSIVADICAVLATTQTKAADLLTLDLRGNGGGDIQTAIDAAACFIEGARPLALARQEQPGQRTSVLKSSQSCVSGHTRLLILQDHSTASAAELFTAVLLEAKGLRVTIGGERSYGKDLWLDSQVLPNGGGLTLPAGRLTTLKGHGWSDGIPVTFPK